MNPAAKVIDIGILDYPGAQVSALHGLTDMFLVANRLCAEQGLTGTPILRVSHWGLDAGGQVTRGFTSPDGAPRSLDVVILPPSLGDPVWPDARDPLLRFLKSLHSKGAVISSVCAGAFLLAEAGLLDGRPATTHWSLAEELQARFPEIAVDGDKLVIDDGDIITAGGVMAWVEMGLKIIERFISPAIVLSVAQFFLVDPAGREQRFYSAFAPKLAHGDAAILKLQHWLQRHAMKKITLPQMAEQAGLGERTFLRRFQHATGHNPTRYLQLLRLAKAREMLELTRRPIEQIAHRIGYEDPGAFAKLFQSQIGLTPSEYRKRFGVGGKQ
ncbi:GlxA family transcriptional regulator [Dongia sp.]|jgi:transcriptional regulator GlxA family with amidase domain|uniref:GlxA family transcriptional regulator n=1 Tax=Dongia sp. TaxID=1977262 RepID=UPI0035B34F2D